MSEIIMTDTYGDRITIVLTDRDEPDIIVRFHCEGDEVYMVFDLATIDEFIANLTAARDELTPA